MADLGTFLKSLTSDKNDLMDSEEYPFEAGRNEEAYMPYIINKCLGKFRDCIMYVNQMNMNSHLPKRMQYHFLLHGISKKKRFERSEKFVNPDLVNAIAEFYQCNLSVANRYYEALTETQKQQLALQLNKGGT